MFQPSFKRKILQCVSAELPDCSKELPREVSAPRSGGCLMTGCPHEGGRGHLMTGCCFIFDCLEEAWLQVGQDCCGMYLSSENTVDLGRIGLFSNDIIILYSVILGIGEVHCWYRTWKGDLNML